MNEQRPHLNESDPDDRILDKCLKELKLLPIQTSGGSIIGPQS